MSAAAQMPPLLPTRTQLMAIAESDRQRLALFGMPFKEQRRFIMDSSPQKAALCTRRAGKTMAVAIDMCLAHLQWPGAVTLYFGMTASKARNIAWPLLRDIDARCKLGLDFKHQRSEVHATNGSITRFIGLDAAEREKKKQVGEKHPKIWIDEAQDYRIDLRELIERRLGPALVDYRGQLVLTGTPGDFIGPGGDGGRRRHYFFAVTKPIDSTGTPLIHPDEPVEADWSVHRWSAMQNPHERANFAWKLDRIKQLLPRFVESANYRRDYLGLWSVDTDKLVYHVHDDNFVDATPELHSSILGVDLGWHNATAFTVAGWERYEPTLYFTRAYKRRELDLSAVATEVRALVESYGCNWIVVDGANKQAIEELRRRHELPLKAAEKVGKADFIRQLNTDLLTNRIKIVRGQCQDLLDEWATLVWDDKAVAIPREAPSCENDQSDSALYAWRSARNYVVEERPKPRTHQDSEAWADEMWREDERRLREAGLLETSETAGWDDAEPHSR